MLHIVAAKREEPLEDERSVLELKVEEVGIPETEDLGFPLLKYLPLEDSVQEFIYNANAANSNLYSILPSLKEEEEVSAPAPVNDESDPGSATGEEAREQLQESKYDSVVPSTEINYEERKRLALWIMFHTAEFNFLENFYGLSRNVNYHPLA
ncbi:MAG: hypothetical protein Q7S55_03925 [Nanoarchaeota archaeon]|nr:hypothetical protein [Nanoarchaeota archaeon]